MNRDDWLFWGLFLILVAEWLIHRWHVHMLQAHIRELKIGEASI
jgi:hypothetical protein